MSTEQKEHLKDLLNLPSLEVLEKRRVTLQKGVMLLAGRQYTEADLERQLEQWRLRDAIQETRPPGCWCLGLGGGRGQAMSSYGIPLPSEYCSCSDGINLEAEIKDALRIHRRLAIDHRRERKWQATQVPLRFSEMRLATSPIAQTQPGLIKRLQAPDCEGFADPNNPTDEPSDAQWATFWVARLQWEGSWFFHGGYGTGKTGLAVGLAYARLEDGTYGKDGTYLQNILFTTVPAMLSELRSTYGRHEEGKPTEQDVLRKYISVDLLILDDLGAEQVKDTGWVEDRLYQVIGTRHDELRSTIFTSNLNLEQLAQRIGERTVWRIAEMCGPSNIVEVKGPNLRSP